MYRNNFADGVYQSWGPVGHMGTWGPEGWMLVALAIAAPLIIAAILWAVVWKGLALWHAARRGEYWWFLALLVINTLGLLEIIYLFFVAKLKFKDLFTSHSGHADHPHHHNHS